ncbi:hypothetical protein [Streptomyces sp. NPDC001100]
MPGQQHGPGSSPPFTDEQIVNWLIDECRDTTSRISALTASGDRILAAGSTVVAVAATVAIGGDKSYFLMWLPLAVAIVIAYGLYLNNMTRALIGYKWGLEKEINRRVGVPVIAWQSHVFTGSKRHVTSLLFLCATFYTASVGLGLAEAFRTLSPGAWGHERAWLYIALTLTGALAGLGVVAYCYWMQRGLGRSTAQRVTDMFAAHTSP